MANKNNPVLAFLLTGSILLSLAACQPSNIKLQQELNHIHNTYHSATYPFSNRQSYMSGQWVTYKIIESNSEEMFRLFKGSEAYSALTLTILSVNVNAFWLQRKLVNSKTENTTSALLLRSQSTHNQGFTISRLKLNSTDTEIADTQFDQLDDDQKAILESMQLLADLLSRYQLQGRSRNIQTPAGSFHQCKEVPISSSLHLGQLTGNALYHPAVPILSMVKLQTIQETSRWFKKQIVWELVDFGNEPKSLTGIEQ